MWDAYRAVDERANSEILADDFGAVHPDGSVHIGTPTAKEIAAAPSHSRRPDLPVSFESAQTAATWRLLPVGVRAYS
jgi:hypothetical protein